MNTRTRTDRTVYIERDGKKLVRFDISGKWYIEHHIGRTLVTIQEAAQTVIDWTASGLVYREGRAGARRLDSEIRKIVANR